MQATCFKRLAGRGAGVTLFGIFLVNLSVFCEAQSGAVPAPHSAPAAAARPVGHPRGEHEGIKVHGHWTIEVKNPDGKLVSHTEFENALVQPEGAKTLAYLLLGIEVPGGYLVTLTNGAATGTGPCGALANGNTSCNLLGSLLSPAPATFIDESSHCGFGGPAHNAVTATGPCYPLSIGTANGGVGLSISGTAVASTATSITDVYLYPVLCNDPGGRNSIGGATDSPNGCAESEGAASTFTHATLQTPVPITVAGQLIAVTVQLSFQ